MSTPTERAVRPETEPEQHPWRSPEDRRGWQVVAVGNRHPGAFMRQVQEHLYHADLLPGAAATAYRPAARAIVEALLGRGPETTSPEDVHQIVKASVRELAASSPDAATLASLASKIDLVWRHYAAA